MAGGSSRWAFSNEPQFGTQMPGAGAVHPIRSFLSSILPSVKETFKLYHPK
jgi:hypothetical protein